MLPWTLSTRRLLHIADPCFACERGRYAASTATGDSPGSLAIYAHRTLSSPAARAIRLWRCQHTGDIRCCVCWGRAGRTEPARWLEGIAGDPWPEGCSH